MLRLRTLGALTLLLDGSSRPLAGRSRLAVLALLAVSGDAGASRDKLQAWLWPDSSGANARHALEQLLYGLRRELGDEAFRGTNPVALNPAAVESDVQRFLQHLERGEREAAISCYGGPFLDGFFLNDAPEFERWVDGERAHLARLHVSAIEALAREATAHGDAAGAVRHWRAFAAADPVSAHGAVGLIGALAASGDVAGALRHARTYETVVKQELDAEPDSTVQTLVERLRRAPPPGDAQVLAPPVVSAVDVAPPEPVAPPPVAESPNGPDSPAPSRVSVATLTLRSRWRQPVWGLAATLLIVAALGLLWWRSGHTDTRELDQSRFAVLPFRLVSQDTSLRYLREGLVDLLALGLRGDGRSTVDPRVAIAAWRRVERDTANAADDDADIEVARSLHSAFLVRGSAIETPGAMLAVHAVLVSTRDGRELARATVTGSATDVVALTGRLAAELLARNAGEYEERLAHLTTASPAALQAYLEGRAEQRRGEQRAAIESLSRAISIDSTFALAALQLVSTIGGPFWWTTPESPHGAGVRLGSSSVLRESNFEMKWRALWIASRLRDRLGPADAAMLEAWRGPHFPDPSFASEVLAGWERAARAAPDRAEAWYWLGDVLLQQGQAMGITDAPARARAVFDIARELDSAYLAPVAGLIELAAHDRDTTSLRTLGDWYLRRDSTSEGAEFVRWRVAAGVGDSESLARIRMQMNGFDATTLDRIQWAAQMDGVAVDDADRAMSTLIRRAGDHAERSFALYAAMMLALNRGRPQQGESLNRLNAQLMDEQTAEHNTIMNALFWGGDSIAAMRAVRHASADPAGEPFEVTLWRAWHGDTIGVRRLASAGEERVGPIPTLLTALAAQQEHAPDAAALRLRLDSLAVRGCCNQPHWVNVVAVRLHEREGDLVAALGAARRCRWLYGPQFLSSCLRDEARLSMRTGDRAGARRAITHLLALAAAPEPSRRADTDSLRALLGELRRGAPPLGNATGALAQH